MAKQRKIKFYTQKNHYLTVDSSNKSSLVKISLIAFNGIFNFFYFIGKNFLEACIFVKKTAASAFSNDESLTRALFIKIPKKLKTDILKTRQLWQKRHKIFFSKKTAKSLFSFVIIIFIACSAIVFFNLIGRALRIKSEVMQTAAAGNAYLNLAKGEILEKKYDLADGNFILAEKTFNRGLGQLNSGGAFFNTVFNLFPQKQDAERVIEAAKLISSAGQNFISLEQQAALLKVSPAGITSENGSFSDILQNINSELIGASFKLNSAEKLTQQINVNSLPAGQRQTFISLKSQLGSISFVLDNFVKVSAFIKDCLIGQKSLLILFENNNELRATGGFIGTFGDLSLKDGAIAKMNVSSIYDLDGQLQENIQPPFPILNLSDKLYLRDSNWFADFPTSAKTISNFYEREGGQTPDLIVAMTPNLIINLLKVIGPISLPKYGVTLNADNFVEQTQAVSTISDNMPTNSPKQILADLVPLLLQKISQANKEQLSQIAENLQNNLNEKQIVIYSRDQDIENQAAAFHWDGSLADTDRDYLSVVSSNLGGTKTDLNIKQQINLAAVIQNDGSINEELSITRTNTLPPLSATENDSFLRIYVPEGSKLISSTGFDQKKLAYPAGENYKTEDNIYVWNKNSSQDAGTGTTIGIESGKTIFGNWLNLKGGEAKTVTLTYQLPFKLTGTDRYSLLLQKQIGSLNQNFSWKLSYGGRKIDWKNFIAGETGSNTLNSDIILDKDYLFGLVLTKN